MHQTFDEFANIAMARSLSPQGAVNFYELLGVSRDAVGAAIIESHVKHLVEIPYVARYMDRYLQADVSQQSALWDAFQHYRRNPVKDKMRYDELMHAYERFLSSL